MNQVLLALTGLAALLQFAQGCPMIYIPVCGSDGVTYTNECFMRAHAHLHNLTLTVTTYGKCGDLSLTVLTPKVEDICSFPSDTGPCKAAFLRWYYDTRTGKCSQFIYGGCDGNKNNFETQEDCEKKCDSDKTAEFPCIRGLEKVLSPAFLVGGEPVPIHNNSYLPQCDKEGYFIHKQCDKSKGECWCVNKLGKEILNTRRKGQDVSCDVCSLPKVVGPCLASIPRWVFNKASKRCKTFIYGGCKGNANNFEGKDKCQAMCLPHKLRDEKVPSRCERELLEATRKPLLGRFAPRCNPDGSYHLKQCHPSTGFCWCSYSDGTRYPGSEVQGRPDCDKYKSLPAVTALLAALPEYPCFRALQKSFGLAILVHNEPFSKQKNNSLPQCDKDGYFTHKQCDQSAGECWCVDKLGKEILRTRTKGQNVSCEVCSLPKVVGPCNCGAAFPQWFFNNVSGKCEKFIYGGCQGNKNNFEGKKKCQAMCLPHKLRVAPTTCQKEVFEATQKYLVGRFTPRCNPDGSYHLIQCHSSTGFCWCSHPDGTRYPGSEIRGVPNCENYKSLPEVRSLLAAEPEAPVTTSKKKTVVKASFEEKQTDNTNNGSPSSSGVETTVIVVVVCAALCILVVAVVLMAKRRRGHATYNKLPETTFDATAGEKQPLVIRA